MNSFGVLLFCIQACFMHNVFSQCIAGNNIGYGSGIAGPGFAPGFIGSGLPSASLAGPYAAPGPVGNAGFGAPGIQGVGLGTYGGSGTGDVAVMGDLPVTGTTIVTGQMPIIGKVLFSGPIHAAGAVSISGFCNCGCNSRFASISESRFNN